MADASRDPDRRGDTDEGLDRVSTTARAGTPRWVKVFGIITLVVLVLMVVLLFAIGGEHGPGRHLPAGDDGSHPPPVAYSVHRP